MSRRAFIRWMLGVIVMAIGMVAGLRKLLQYIFVPEQNTASGQGVVKDSLSTQNVSSELSRTHQEASALTQTEGAAPLMSFFLLSDLHVNSAFEEQSKHLRQTLDDIKKFEPKSDVLVITGDLTDTGTESDYKELKRVMKGYDLPPIYANMGNHDFYNIWIDKSGQWNKDAVPNGKTDAQSREAFKKFFGLNQIYNDVWVNGVHIIMMSQETYVQERPEVGEGAWYSNEQMAWLREKMAQHKDGKPALVMIHQPLPAIGQDGGSHSLIRAKEFREILQEYPNTFVFSGHTHQDFLNGRSHYVKETFHWIQNSSIGRVANRQYAVDRKSSAQGLHVQVFADKVVVRGREFSDGTWIDEAKWTLPLKSVKV